MRDNPVETFVRIATAESYVYERVGDQEVHISLTGMWCDHDLSLSWNAAEEQLSLLSCSTGKSLEGDLTPFVACSLCSMSI